MDVHRVVVGSDDAHGGLQRWNEFTTLKAELSVDGAIWHAKQQPGLLADKMFEIDTHKERLTITPFTAPESSNKASAAANPAKTSTPSFSASAPRMGIN